METLFHLDSFFNSLSVLDNIFSNFSLFFQSLRNRHSRRSRHTKSCSQMTRCQKHSHRRHERDGQDPTGTGNGSGSGSRNGRPEDAAESADRICRIFFVAAVHERVAGQVLPPPLVVGHQVSVGLGGVTVV